MDQGFTSDGVLGAGNASHNSDYNFGIGCQFIRNVRCIHNYRFIIVEVVNN